jgi:thiol-disulfide isomerase/thioredoxin
MRTLVSVVAPALLIASLALAQTATPPTPPTPTRPAPAEKDAPKAPGKDGSKGAPKDAPPAAEPTLKVGDAAPALSIDAWVKGESVAELKRGHVYVVEFWATWCGPCIKGIPHLTTLQKQHKDKVTIIGVAASERRPRNAKEGDPDRRLDRLKEFVAKQGDEMAYTVAFDADRSMSRDWMQPAARRTIPTAFIVGHDGKIAYIGSPLDKDFDAAVEKAVKASALAGPGVKPSDA